VSEKRYVLKRGSFIDAVEIFQNGNNIGEYENNNEIIKEVTMFYLDQQEYRPEDIQECKRIYQIICTFKEFIEEILTLPFLERLIQKIDKEPNAS
jgi:hypothetical protein